MKVILRSGLMSICHKMYLCHKNVFITIFYFCFEEELILRNDKVVKKLWLIYCNYCDKKFLKMSPDADFDKKELYLKINPICLW